MPLVPHVSYVLAFVLLLFQSALHYSMEGIDNGPGYFKIDRTSGVVSIAADLLKGSEMEYTVG